MIPSIPQPRALKLIYMAYIAVFFVYLAAPLIVVTAFSFNDSMFPSLPWNGFTLDWFVNDTAPRTGLFHDGRILESIWISLVVACLVTLLSVAVGTCNAFLFERHDFPFKELLYLAMLAPLVIPGVILGISILVFSNTLINWLDALFGIEVEALRPGLMLVVLGQFSFIATISTLVIAARLRKFDTTLEEAARNLGASHWRAIRTVTLPYLRPAMIGAGIVALLMSFENFNTTLILVGPDAPLTITMFGRLREGSTPVLNAVSLFLMVVSGGLAVLSLFVQRPENESED
ncbi:MAG: ABC transporter permease [Alphaproteobacteria bacterium]|nr:ABC transporter permease [Alphaproteobacteria bacterium]